MVQPPDDSSPVPPAPECTPAETEADPLVGQVLARRFEIVAPIAAGGMGRIYRAIQRPVDRLVALKILNPRLNPAKASFFEDRFFLEALMTAKLRHPNTVTLLDYGRSEEGHYFMALELLEGESLQQLLARSGALPWTRALSIGAQVARSLREAHLLGLVHRDLKPANIMVLTEGLLGDRVKVLDFGLVKAVENLAVASAGEANSVLTDASLVLGSPLYMSPEQAKKEADHRSDIYSLGVVLFTSIAGRTPFVGKSPIDILIKHLNDPPPRLASLAEVPDDVEALVMKCLAKSPEERFQTMDDLLLAMHHTLRAHGLGGLFIEEPSPVAPPRLPTPERGPTEVLSAPPPPMASPRLTSPQLPPPLPAPVPQAAPVAVQALVAPSTKTPARGTPRPQRLEPKARRWRWGFAWTGLFAAGFATMTALFAVGAKQAQATVDSGPQPVRVAVDTAPVAPVASGLSVQLEQNDDALELPKEVLPRRIILPLLQEAVQRGPQSSFGALPSRAPFSRRAPSSAEATADEATAGEVAPAEAPKSAAPRAHRRDSNE